MHALPRSLPAAVAGVLLVLVACSHGGRRAAGLAPPPFQAAKFSNPAAVTNPHFPLVAGTAHAFAVAGDGERETIVVEVLATTRTVLGLPCAVVRDRVFADGLLREDTRDFYAQDDAGNVWYMGEEVDDYEYDEQGSLIGVTHYGAWEAGRDVAGRGVLAEPGWKMPGDPRPGTKYLQEYYRGAAEDTGEVVATGVPVTLADGTTHVCVQIRDASRLTPGEELKFYAPGLGLVREQHVGSDRRGELVGRFRPGPGSVPDFSAATFADPTTITHPRLPSAPGVARVYSGASADGTETIVVERLGEAKTVLGVPCAVVRDRVFRAGLLVEDTRDWYAQDDAGNVWYMGEAVDNYEYDEQGNLIGVDHDGSWEAGLDVAAVGAIAQAGIQSPAAPVPGSSWHQEWYPGEATDMVYVVAVGVAVELPDGRTFTGCVQTLDWNPLDPDGLEYKFHAPGHGLVLEQALHDDEELAHVGTFALGASAVPDFGAATFGNPTLVDHEFFPLPGGASWSYEKPTAEGLEQVTVAVQAAPRTVLGVPCLEALYEKRLAGRLVEVARDWYAQDDAGNVWYLGEAVDNYRYGGNGVLLEITHEGSWEAGLDVGNVGHLAQPGLIMPADPQVGRSYYQEYYRTAAEDLGFVVATDVELAIAGRTFADCVQTLDWNPLEPDALEYKYYAPGVGLVLEHRVDDDEGRAVLIASTLLRD